MSGKMQSNEPLNTIDIAALLDEPRFVTETGVAARIAMLIIPVLRDLTLRLVRVRILSQQQTVVQIMIERPDGRVGIDECEQASLAISPVLDVEEVMPQVWTLEVSSPGIDRPLVRLSDLRRGIEHEAKLETVALVNGRKRFRGWIKAVEGEGSEARLDVRLTDSHPDEPADITLKVEDLAEGHLILTHALVQEALRLHKHDQERQSETDAPDADGEMQEALPARVKRGPGRFTRAQKQVGKRISKV